jgi:hypothetical protein
MHGRLQSMLAQNILLLGFIVDMHLRCDYFGTADCEETSIPNIIGILCHQVLHHPSDHGTSSMGKHLLGKADIAKVNK